jgi:fatty acid desaturase
MALSESPIRPLAPALHHLDAPEILTDSLKPSYDASPEAYRRLRRTVIDAGLLERRYGYYLWRAPLCFAFLAVGLTLAFTVPVGLGWAALAGAVIGFAVGQIGLIGHDCGHHQVFKRAWPNWWVGQFCFSVMLGIGFWSWRWRHNVHHVETNDEEDDPDLSFGGFFTLNEEDAASRRGLSRVIVRYQAWLLMPVLFAMLSIVFRAAGWRYAIVDLRGRKRVVELSLLVLNAVVWMLPALVLGWQWIVIFVLSQGIAGFYMGMTIAPNHKGMPTWAHGTKLTFLERQVLGSRNILPGRIAELMFGGLNYQIEHHLFPTMPRANLGAAHDIVMPFCRAQGIPYEEVSAWESYRQTFAAMDRCGRATGLAVGRTRGNT